MKRNSLDRMEIVLLYIVTSCLFLVFLTQLVFLNEKIRWYLVPVERLEGVDLKLYSPEKIARRIQNFSHSGKSEAEIEKIVNEYGPAEEQGVIDAAQTGRGMISVKLLDISSAPYAKVLVNNEEMADFTESEVSLFVSRGDFIQIDGSTYLGKLRFKIYGVSNNLAFPKQNSLIETNASITNIGEISVK